MSDHLDLFGNPISEPKGRKKAVKAAVKPKTAPDAPKNQVADFRFDDAHQVRVVMIDDEPWWVLADLAKILGYRDSADAGRRVKSTSLHTHPLCTGAGSRGMTVVSESGMYRLIIRSNKPDAERFQDWICEEVLPAIRRYGVYDATSPHAKIQNRLKCDPVTAAQRALLINMNKLLHDVIHANGGQPLDYAIVHNTIYRAMNGETAKGMRKSLGLPKSATPLDRFSRTCLAQCNVVTEIMVRLIENGDIPRGQEQNRYCEILKGVIEAEVKALGPDCYYGIRLDPVRGKIVDVFMPKLAKPA